MGLLDFLKRKPEPLSKTGTEMQDNARSIIVAHSSRPSMLTGFGAAMFYLQQDFRHHGQLNLATMFDGASTVERGQRVSLAQEALMNVQKIAEAQANALSSPQGIDEAENLWKLRSYDAIKARTRSHAAQVWLFMVVAQYAGNDRNKLRQALTEVWKPLLTISSGELLAWAEIYRCDYVAGNEYEPVLADWDAIERLAS